MWKEQEALAQRGREPVVWHSRILVYSCLALTSKAQVDAAHSVGLCLQHVGTASKPRYLTLRGTLTYYPGQENKSLSQEGRLQSQL